MTEIPETITRIDLVGGCRCGHPHEYWADEWEVSVQDDGKTLKLFAKGEGKQAQATRVASLSQALQWLDLRTTNHHRVDVHALGVHFETHVVPHGIAAKAVHEPSGTVGDGRGDTANQASANAWFDLCTKMMAK
jgi:hypothetical protein